jgi:hypothetical protein
VYAMIVGLSLVVLVVDHVLSKCTVFSLKQTWPWKHLRMTSFREQHLAIESIVHFDSSNFTLHRVGSDARVVVSSKYLRESL